ncbi:MAG: RHS repeat protein, partial [Aquabacterium sp.]|nr:RHS repeat protein [Aquabacterium sp.]
MTDLLFSTSIHKRFWGAMLIWLTTGEAYAAQFMVTRDPVITWCKNYDGTNRCVSKPGTLFSAWNDYYMNEQAKTPNANCVRYNSNFRGNGTYLNGQPSTFVYDMTEVCKSPSSTTTTVGVGFQTTYNAYCGDWSLSNRFYGSGIFSATCYNYINISEPPQNGSCPNGNPVYPDSGLKVQNELDYISADGLIRFERRYRSDLGSFVSPTRGPIFDTANWSGRAVLVGPNGKISAFRSTSPSSFTPDANGLDRVVQNGAGTRWWVYRNNMHLEEYSLSGGLSSITLPDGRATKFARVETIVDGPYPFIFGETSGQSDQFGRTLSFEYNEHGRLGALTDPEGRKYVYEHDASDSSCASGLCDRLTKVIYPDGFARQYLFNEPAYTSGANLVGALTGINEIWPNEGTTAGKTVRVGTYTYDSSGKAIQTERANGLDRYSFALQMGSTDGFVTVTDPLNTKRTITLTPFLGANYPSAESQPEGAGCLASSSNTLYDKANGNVLSKDDFNGHRTCYAYSTASATSVGNLEITRVEGLPNTATCSGVLTNGVSLPLTNGTQSRKISTQWHPQWAL